MSTHPIPFLLFENKKFTDFTIFTSDNVKIGCLGCHLPRVQRGQGVVTVSALSVLESPVNERLNRRRVSGGGVGRRNTLTERWCVSDRDPLIKTVRILWEVVTITRLLSKT